VDLPTVSLGDQRDAFRLRRLEGDADAAIASLGAFLPAAASPASSRSCGRDVWIDAWWKGVKGVGNGGEMALLFGRVLFLGLCWVNMRIWEDRDQLIG
jgi:hypothetical protein